MPLGVAETLGMACITLGKKVTLPDDQKVVVERLAPDGYEVVEADLPALVTVSNELGQPRYPTLRGIMAATRKRPTVWTAGDLPLDDGSWNRASPSTTSLSPSATRNARSLPAMTTWTPRASWL